MRVIHCGGFGALTEALAASESDLGVASEALGGTSSEAFWGFSPAGAVADLGAAIRAKRPDILVVHGSLALGGAFGLNVVPAMDLLRELRTQGTRVVYWSQGAEPFAHSAQRTKAKFSAVLFKESVNHVLLSSLEALELARLAQGFSWLALPAPLALFDGAGAREYDRGHFRFSGLMVPFQLSPMTVTKVQEALLANKSPLTLQVIPPEKIDSLSALRDAISAVDLVIDAPDSSNYGPLGLLSLAAGRPLFSGISPLLKKEWPSQELCPAIGVDPSTIADKVRHILMEPRMLRDLGKRARNFALERHHPSRVAPLTLQLYQRLIG